MDKLIEPYEPYFIKQLATGSRVICNPPVLDTDVDFLLLSYNGAVRAFEERLKADGFVLGGSLGVSDDPLEEEFNKTPTGMFHSWKRPLKGFKKGEDVELNLLVTLSPEYFDRFTNATNLAKKLNLLKKEDRIALFQGVVCEDFPVSFEEKYGYKLFKWDFGRGLEPGVPDPIQINRERVAELEEEIRLQQIVGLAQPGDVDGIPQLVRELDNIEVGN